MVNCINGNDDTMGGSPQIEANMSVVHNILNGTNWDAKVADLTCGELLIAA